MREREGAVWAMTAASDPVSKRGAEAGVTGTVFVEGRRYSPGGEKQLADADAAAPAAAVAAARWLKYSFFVRLPVLEGWRIGSVFFSAFFVRCTFSKSAPLFCVLGPLVSHDASPSERKYAASRAQSGRTSRRKERRGLNKTEKNGKKPNQVCFTFQVAYIVQHSF